MRTALGDRPLVTAIIVCRNDARHIGHCLESLVGMDYPKERLEVVVCDGSSKDGTREIVREYAARYPFIRLRDNPKKTLASGWNVGVENASGDLICTLIAHQTYRTDYLSGSLRYLREYDADGVGGAIETVPQTDSAIGRAIAAVWSHPFGVGNSYFRIGTSRPRWVDNIHCGVYRRSVFERVGKYNERLTRSQDADFQSRVRNAGGRLLLVPDVFSTYHTRSRYLSFARYAFVNGFWVVKPLEQGTFLRSIRHWVPLVFVVALAVLVAWSIVSGLGRIALAAAIVLYLILAVIAGVTVSLRRRDLRYLLLMPLMFATLHFGYGLGAAAGLMDLARARSGRRVGPPEADGAPLAG